MFATSNPVFLEEEQTSYFYLGPSKNSPLELLILNTYENNGLFQKEVLIMNHCKGPYLTKRIMNGIYWGYELTH